MKRPTVFSSPLSLLLSIVLVAGSSGLALAYETYDAGCITCHGDFRSSAYTSLVDGVNWGNLHNVHRTNMLSGDCNVCHAGADRFPVPIAFSDGGTGLSPIGCMGCHGRAEDNTAANPNFPNGGAGAGLRQVHFRAGVTGCETCHADASPAAFTPAGERVLPPYYANPGTAHPAMPRSACNADGSENFAGTPIGLDNDGDGLYDGNDPGCGASATPDLPGEAALAVRNYPNPFNPATMIQYRMPTPGFARLQVFAADGRLVRELVARDHETAGAYEVRWDGLDDHGMPVASGMYLYQLKTADAVAVSRMALLR